MKVSEKKFISNVFASVKKYAHWYNIRSFSPVIAQCIIESDWGNSELARNANNYFNIIADENWNGKTYEYPKIIKIDDRRYEKKYIKLCAYDSLDESVEEYFKYLKNNYADIQYVINEEVFIDRLIENGYKPFESISVDYKQCVMKLIDEYELRTYDAYNHKEGSSEFRSTTALKNSLRRKKEKKFYDRYTGKDSSDIDKVLKEIGVPSKYTGSISARKELAKANGYKYYTGSDNDNRKLLLLAWTGRLRKVK